MATIPVLTRLDIALAHALDALAKEAGTSRADVVREMLEKALATSQTGTVTSTTDEALDRIADELGSLAARVDAGMAASRNAYAASKLAALMLLPQDRQQMFVDKLGQAVRA